MEIRTLPAIVFLSNLYENYKREQDDIKRHKLCFLYRQAYNNFYEQYLIQHTLRARFEIDLPPFLYAERDAREKAMEVVLQVAKNNRINQCYSARIKELRKIGLIK